MEDDNLSQQHDDQAEQSDPQAPPDEPSAEAEQPVEHCQCCNCGNARQEDCDCDCNGDGTECTCTCENAGPEKKAKADESSDSDDTNESADDAAVAAEERELAEKIEAAAPAPETEGLPGNDQAEVPVSAAEEPAPPCTNVKAALEVLLFSADEPLAPSRLADAIGGITAGTVREELAALQAEYDAQGRGFALREIAGGFQLFSRPTFSHYLERLQKKQVRTKLSAASLETLAIIAYKQPIGRADIESIRGVQAGPLLRMLMEKGMVQITGRQEVIGRPFLYGTTKKFLEHFGLKSLTDLPQADQLKLP